MFVNNPLSSKSEQVSEQVFQPIRVPVIIGNDVYIVTQQDVRNIIETRHISCFKCLNGLRDLQDFFVHTNSK
ncbi:unnamed protein product [Hermetia illucens]|uniref:Uncharacterized protein n=1 Tax=Hermetia illucens TaxID=343691 RepID=A0A7R8V7N6_HERIL|nr:unnamed protein product [Hermetia illucens]